MESPMTRINAIACRRAMVLMFCGLMLLAGCAQQVRVPRKLMAIPPAQQVIHRLNARAALLGTLRLTGNVNLTLIHHHGGASSFQAHAVLLVDQHRIPHLLLVGTYLGQDAFEMGMNRRIYWLIDHEHKIAYVGRVAAEYRLPSDVMPLRPQRILDMLGITPLIRTGASRVAMFNFPHADQYHLLLLHDGGNGLVHIERQISISRYTGQIREVRLYDRNGRVIAYARLSEYHPVGNAFGGVELPMHIVIHYLDVRARMDFHVQRATLKLSGKAKFIFASPSFQGLKVADIDNPANWPAKSLRGSSANGRAR
jgi:hypothetical protein